MSGVAPGRRPTYANVTATLALVVALSTGAFAVATIGPGDIQRRAIRARHVMGDAIRPRHIKPDFLHANRVLRNTVDATQETSENRLIFRDRRTGLALRVGEFASLRFANTNDSALISVRGIGFYSNSDPDGRFFTLDPGEQDDMFFDATGFTFFTGIAQRRSPNPGAPALTFSCTLHYAAPLPAISCVGVG